MQLQNFLWQSYFRSWSRELLAPADMVNLMELGDEQAYLDYAQILMPLVALAGGRIIWMGQVSRELCAARDPGRRFDLAFVMRYPDHRAFLSMISNPVYLVANSSREKAQNYFEFAFTACYLHDRAISSASELLMLRCPIILRNELSRLAATGGSELVYATEMAFPLEFVQGDHPALPRPLSYEIFAWLTPGKDDVIIREISRITPDFSLHSCVRKDYADLPAWDWVSRA